jgi:hypothetical protein
MASDTCYVTNASSEMLTEEAWSRSELGIQYEINGVVLAIVLSVFLITGLSLNLAVIVSIVKKKLYVQPTLLLLLNLSITDLLLCAAVMPFHVVTGFSGEFIFGSSDVVRCRVCKIGIALITFSFMSLHSLALISMDRLLFIKKPLRYHKIVTVPRVLVAVSFTWCICIGISIPPLFGFGEIRYSHSLSHCLIYIHSDYVYIYLLVGETMIPLVALLSSSIWVACIAQKHLKLVYGTSTQLNPITSQEVADSKLAKKNKSKLQFHLFRVFGAIIIGNILTWFPILVFAVIGTFLDRDEIPLEYKTFSYLCFLFQPVLHPALENGFVSEIEFPILRELRSCWHLCTSKLCKKDKDACRQCGFGVGLNGLRVGIMNGTCMCRACGLLDTCSAAVLIHRQPEADCEEAV